MLLENPEHIDSDPKSYLFRKTKSLKPDMAFYN